MSAASQPSRPSVPPAHDRSHASLRSEFRAILAVYVFSALLPLLAGFSCSSEREHRLRQRERAEQGSAPAAPAPAPRVGETQG
ncbi:MAG: hypothetical protein IPN34_20745 [Planctomycetes bacterium]|nr:hypothetical protein [Planctomycetota bacterium]